MAKKEHNTLLIVDGYSLLYRAWHALPPLTTSSGEVVNAVYGFATILLKAIKDFKATHVAVAFDLAKPTFRHEAYKEYKAQREKQPDEFYAQIAHVREFLQSLGIPSYEKEGFEADDVIATIARLFEKQHPGLQTLILTGDMDAIALVDEQTHVCTPKKGISDIVVYDLEAVKEKFNGLVPSDMPLYKTLRGDPSDNIPGVKGIGEKTAMTLAGKYHTLDNLLDGIEQGETSLNETLAQGMLSQREDLYNTLSLVTLRDDVLFDFSIDDMKFGEGVDAPRLVKLFQTLEFKTLLSRLKEFGIAQRAPSVHEENGNYVCVNTTKTFDEFYTALQKQKEIAVDTETTNIDPFQCSLVGISMSWEEGRGYYLPWSALNATQKKKIITVLQDEDIKKIGHNIKYDIESLAQGDIALKGIYFDTMIAAYLLNSGVRTYGLDILAFSEFGHQKIPTTDLIGEKTATQITMDKVPLEKIAPYACEDADFTWRLYKHFSKQMADIALTPLFDDIEMPLVSVLADMESHGILLDVPFLKTFSKKVHTTRNTIQKKIYNTAGQEFNIDSPSQLKNILFEVLEISSRNIRKGKTGFSTAASELEKMRGSHPIIELIMQYREVSKLLNTYIDTLPDLINPKTKCIHTSYNQTIASTGRLSSSNPNLQNIPIRTELGREIRKAFVAAKGMTLLAADYSQIELRVVASLANDLKMIQAFKEGVDIHMATAAEVNNVSLDAVTKAMRRAAKTINFGVLYGMGPQGLAEGAGITYDEAMDFIDRYYVAYPDVRKYMDEILQQARSLGYVETFFGRRRYIPELKSSVMQVRRSAERTAINMPVQGTAADIMKKAMIAVAQRIKKEKARNDVAMVLQVHDELVFEISTAKVKTVAQWIQEEMEHVVQLKVPLEVEISSGKNWGTLSSLSLWL
ncbi:MAG: DNA polymerase I [bacterium]|nr:DNA polymerase I [bacterium]